LTPDEFGAAFDAFNQEWQRIQDLLQKLRSGGRVETRGRKKGSASVHDLNTKAGQVAAAGEQDDSAFDAEDAELVAE
jgi:hypothetical protein